MLYEGEYTFIGEAELPSGENIISNEESIIVQGLNIESADLIQNKNLLKQVVQKSGGVYIPIDSLDTMISNIEIIPIQFDKKYHISGLSTQNYWWILIILLSFEWFLRKKIGLL